MLDSHDHRQIAQRLRLVHFQDEAPGMAFWHPRGFQLYRLLEEAVRAQLARSGYLEVRTPQLLRQPIWEASGHWSHFPEGIFKLEDRDELGAALKPVSCPGHVQIYQQRVPSYRELPLRMAEFGLVHRKEPSGTLHGLFRLRQFTQDDGHIFCLESQMVDEIAAFCASVGPFYAAFGFDDIRVGLSTRPPQRFGSDDQWDAAEAALAEAAACVGLEVHLQPGEGAFYGPKLEFELADRLGRIWQCGTIQADFVMPERFDLRYVAADNGREHPVMLHRALYGSLERFMGVLLEQHEGRLPAWLAPDQIAVLPVGEAHEAYACEVRDTLAARGLRAFVDASSERVGRRVAEVLALAVPWICVVGDREVDAHAISVRGSDDAQLLPLSDGVAWLDVACRPPAAARA